MARLKAPQRKQQLLDVAAGLFARQGYARATTAQLAQAAGVTEPIIYRHFASKRDLFVALVERTAQRTREHWQATLATAKDPAVRLRRLLAENPMVHDDLREHYRVFLQAITETQDAKIRKAVHAHISELHAFLAGEIKTAQGEKRVTRVFDASAIAWVLVHVGLGYGVLDAMRYPLSESKSESTSDTDTQGAAAQEIIGRLLVGRAGEE